MPHDPQPHLWDGPGGPFEGVLVRPDGPPRGAVLIYPTVMGPGPLETRVAQRLAADGRLALVADVYGRERHPRGEWDAARAQMDAQNADRPLLAQRVRAAFDALLALDGVEPARTAAFGYCFGGKCALDLARSGAPVAGIVGFHAVLDPPPGAAPERIAAKVLLTHGWDDPLAAPDAVLALAAELTAAGAEWQLHAYGGTVHAFTNPGRPEMYSEAADRRSWRAATDFLDEVLG